MGAEVTIKVEELFYYMFKVQSYDHIVQIAIFSIHSSGGPNIWRVCGENLGRRTIARLVFYLVLESETLSGDC